MSAVEFIATPREDFLALTTPVAILISVPWFPGTASNNPSTTVSTAGHKETPTPVGNPFLVEVLTKTFEFYHSLKEKKWSSNLIFW